MSQRTRGAFRARISPGGGGLEKLTIASEKLKATLDAALQQIGVSQVAEAEERERVKGQLIVEYKSATQDVQIRKLNYKRDSLEDIFLKAMEN